MALLDLWRQPLRDIHGEPPAPTPAVERVVRVKFTAAQAGNSVDTAASPQESDPMATGHIRRIAPVNQDRTRSGVSRLMHAC